MTLNQKPPWDEGPAALVAFFTEAIRQDPANPRLYYERGRWRAALADYDEARADLDTALRIDPAMAWAWYQRGLVREAQGDLIGAAADFRQALEHRIRTSGWQFSLALGRVELAQDHPAQAAEALDRVLRVRPGSAEARALQAMLRQAGDT